jgi:hypothetical protein
MDLCTVTNKRYVKNAINLINSYRVNSYNQKVYFYCFDMNQEEIKNLSELYKEITFLEVPKVCEWAYKPTVFFYKTFAINDCINKSDGLIYSDATNVFNRYVDIKNYLIDDSLFLPYNHERLLNKYWTTNKCFEKMECNSAKNMMQYWAGFQAYMSTKENKQFVQEMYNYMLDSDIALPDTTKNTPDGINATCNQHRCDQSVLSLLINKYFRHQRYDHNRQLLFGDWQTYQSFDNNYRHDMLYCALSSRESKFNNYRFL